MNRNKSNYNIAEVLSGKDFQFISDLANERYNNELWKMYCDLSPVQRSRTWNSLVRESNVKVMASVLDVNSAKPLTSLSGFSTYGGDIPKIGIGSKIEEQDILNEMELLAVGAPLETEMAKNLVRVPLSSLYQGIHSKLKFFVLQGISTGRIVVDMNNQVNGKFISVDLNIPSANKVNVAKVWSDATADPIKDLRDKQRFAKNTLKLNLSDFHWEMSQSLYDTFISHPKVESIIKGRLNILNNDYIVTEDEIRAQLLALGIKPFYVVDEVCAFDSDGEAKEVEPFDTDNMSLVPSRFFDMKRAISVQSYIESNTAMRSTVEEVIAAVSTWDDRKGVNNIDVEAWMFPVPKDPKNILILDTATAA